MPDTNEHDPIETLDWIKGVIGSNHPHDWTDDDIAEIERRLSVAIDGEKETPLAVRKFRVYGTITLKIGMVVDAPTHIDAIVGAINQWPGLSSFHYKRHTIGLSTENNNGFIEPEGKAVFTHATPI